MTDVPARMTYAQKKLIDLLKARKLTAFAKDNGIDPTRLRACAVEENGVSFLMVSRLCHVIPPVDWLFHTDEEIPVERKTCQRFDCRTQVSRFVESHKFDYIEFSKENDIPYESAYKIFNIRTANPSLSLMRKLISKANPIDYFIPADSDNDEESQLHEIPERGDLLKFGKNYILVLSNRDHNEKTGTVSGLKILPHGTGRRIESRLYSGFCEENFIVTESIEGKNPLLMGKVDSESVQYCLAKVRVIFS